MSSYTFIVRNGFSVCLGAANANDTVHATVYNGGQNVTLSDAEYDCHAHKVQGTDTPSNNKIAAVAGTIRIGVAGTV